MFQRFAVLALTLIVLFISACGEVVEQNKIVLVFKMLGKRTINIDNVTEGTQTQLLTAGRLALVRAGVKYIIFPRGNQMYRFTELPSVESPTDESFTMVVADGRMKFDVNVQLHIDTSYNDLKNRLVNFCRDYSLLKYADDPNALGRIVSDRLRPELERVFQVAMASKTVLDLTRSKESINNEVTRAMNQKFNPYGIQFTLVGIASSFSVDQEQQTRLNAIVNQEIDSRMVKMETERLLPIEKQIAAYELDGQKEAAGIENSAKIEAAKITSAAWKKRREMLIGALGAENYVRYEKVKSLSTAIQGNDKATVTIVPSDATILLNR